MQVYMRGASPNRHGAVAHIENIYRSRLFGGRIVGISWLSLISLARAGCGCRIQLPSGSASDGLPLPLSVWPKVHGRSDCESDGS